MISLTLPAGIDLPLTSQSTPTAVPGVTSRTTSFALSSLVSASSSTSPGSLFSALPPSSSGPTTEVGLTTERHAGSTNTTSQTTSSSWTSGSQGSLSQLFTSPSTSIATTPLSSSLSSTLTPRPTSLQHGTFVEIDTTSLVVISSYEVPLTSRSSDTRSSQSIATATTSKPEPTLTAAPETPERYNHRLTIDLGDCAGFTSPRLNLLKGELGNLVPAGGGRFEIELKAEPKTKVFGLGVSLKDDGVRCGSEEAASCVSIDIGFGETSELVVNVLKAGDYGIAMYPFSIWLEDGVTWDARHVNSPKEMYHCWGWSDAECPYAFKANGADGAMWTLSTENLSGDVYIGFCPSDGPNWSSIPPNPSPDPYDWGQQSTYIVLPSQTAVPTSTFVKPIVATQLGVPSPIDKSPCDEPSTCIPLSTYIIKEGTTTSRSNFVTPVPDTTRYEGTEIIIDATTTVTETTLITADGLSAIHPSTVIVLDSTITSRKTTFLTTPTPTATSLTVTTLSTKPSIIQPGWSSSPTGPRTRRPTETSLAGSSASVSASTPTVIPTYSHIINSLGSTLSTSSYNVTVSPTPTTTPAPDTQYIITSWSTWMTINGSTVPAIAGEVGVLTKVSMTYLLESGSIIPVSELSTRTVASGQTSSSSSTAAVSADDGHTRQGQGGRIAGAVVGTLVGLVLGSILLWYIFHRRQRRQMRDGFARGDPSWLAPAHEAGSGGGSGPLVDLDQEPRMRNSYIEPWVPPRPVVRSSRKGGWSEMESAPDAYGVSTMAGPSREPELSSNEGGSSWFHESSDQHQVPAATATQAGKSSTRNEPIRRPDVMISQRPVSPSYLGSSLASPSLSLLPTPFRDELPSPLMPTSSHSRPAPLPSQADPPAQAGPPRRRQLDDEEQARHDAIPPLYNEAWNTAR
ncbi:unnamed protein product [Rhizoctonia solani]|uniref:Uncharacterized protein n=1 Tax=Rhizoctonia solani TaxID=456999 RepID=A0A8H3BUV5_9AGAM|nr:unnamed protein product [Rhizoctonia solani]